MSAQVELHDVVERRPIPAAPAYEATSDGRIWSTVTGRFLKGTAKRDGYLYVSLRVNGDYLQGAVHRFIASAFHEREPGKDQINHLNLMKTDNRAVNLEWTTPRENTRHAWDNLPSATVQHMRERRSVGALTVNRNKRVLSPVQIEAVRACLRAGVQHAKIAPLFGVSRRTIDNIAAGRIYVD